MPTMTYKKESIEYRPRKEPVHKDGDLEVWWHRGLNDGTRQHERYAVADLEEAKKLVKQLAEADLKKEADVDFNAHGMEGWNIDGVPGWTEWYDEEGRSLNDIMDEEEEAANAD